MSASRISMRETTSSRGAPEAAARAESRDDESLGCSRAARVDEGDVEAGELGLGECDGFGGGLVGRAELGGEGNADDPVGDGACPFEGFEEGARGGGRRWWGGLARGDELVEAAGGDVDAVGVDLAADTDFEGRKEERQAAR